MRNKWIGAALISLGIILFLVALLGGELFGPRLLVTRLASFAVGMSLIGVGIVWLIMLRNARPHSEHLVPPSEIGHIRHGPAEEATLRGRLQAVQRLGTRPCPHCGETLNNFAVKCPYCKATMDASV